MLLTFCLAACPLSGTGEGMPCTLCLLVLGESGQLVMGAGSERQVIIAVVCGSGIGYWRCAYRVVVPFCLVGYPL